MSSGLYAADIKALAASVSAPETLPQADRQVTVDNPFCGDRIDLQLKIEAGRVKQLAQEIRGCLLCQASANLLAESAIGLSCDEVEIIREELSAMLKNERREPWPPEHRPRS